MAGRIGLAVQYVHTRGVRDATGYQRLAQGEWDAGAATRVDCGRRSCGFSMRFAWETCSCL